MSERILILDIKEEGKQKTFIVAYGPNEDEKSANKDKFWEELTMVTDNIKGKLFVLGDFNGRVGKKDNTYTINVGKHGEINRNNNGIRLLEFCQLNNLIVTNTFYEHKDIHKYTRVEPSRNEKSIIDYILVEKENRREVTDVKVKRSAEISSDHYLLVAYMREPIEQKSNIQTEVEKKIEFETIKAYKLKEEPIARRYQEIINWEIENDSNREEYEKVENMWNKFKQIILKAAKSACGICRTNNNKKLTAWWNDEIKELIKMKKKKWKTYLGNRTEENYNTYKEHRKIVKDSVAAAKEKSWKDFGDKIETNSKGNQKLFYKVLKNLRKEKSHQALAIKDKNGEIITEEQRVMERWTQYFQELLHKDEEELESSTKVSRQKEPINEQGETDEITIEELEEAIKSLKNGKAPGHDKITTEMIKYMSQQGKHRLLKILNKARSKEEIPKDWEVGIILPIFKKGDSKDCNNYRGITLLSTVLKVYERILEKRLRSIIEPTLMESQSGFRKGRSTQDHIFTIKEIINKTLRQGKKVYMAFMDLEKAFDRIPRKRVWETLHNRAVDNKLIKNIQSLYNNNVNYVISKNRKSKLFKTSEGLRQGGVMSPALFILYMDNIIRETNTKSKSLCIGYRNLLRVEITECAFADDIVIMTGSDEDLQKNLVLWNEELKASGMKLNKSKTKVMAIANEELNLNIIIDNTQIEQVRQFQYLGVSVEEKGRQELEINERIEKTIKLYYAINNSFINKKEVSRTTKMKVYKAIYRPILTYGCESWVLNKRLKSKIQATEMKYLRRVQGVTRRDRIRNVRIREELEVESVLELIQTRQLSWWGHLNRMDNKRTVKQVWEARTQAKKKRGRPKETWDNVVEKILEERGYTWREAKTLAQDKKKWCKFVHG